MNLAFFYPFPPFAKYFPWRIFRKLAALSRQQTRPFAVTIFGQPYELSRLWQKFSANLWHGRKAARAMMPAFSTLIQFMDPSTAGKLKQHWAMCPFRGKRGPELADGSFLRL
eukprot:379625-Amphidinium_carterae.1